LHEIVAQWLRIVNLRCEKNRKPGGLPDRDRRSAV